MLARSITQRKDGTRLQRSWRFCGLDRKSASIDLRMPINGEPATGPKSSATADQFVSRQPCRQRPPGRRRLARPDSPDTRPHPARQRQRDRPFRQMASARRARRGGRPADQGLWFDESHTKFEGKGPKLLPLTVRPGDSEPGHISADAERFGTPFIWIQRSQIATGIVDAAIVLADRADSYGKASGESCNVATASGCGS